MNVIIQRQADHHCHQGNMVSQLFLNIASQMVQFIYYSHYFGQLCVHDPERPSRETGVSRFAVILVPSFFVLFSSFTWWLFFFYLSCYVSFGWCGFLLTIWLCNGHRPSSLWTSFYKHTNDFQLWGVIY